MSAAHTPTSLRGGLLGFFLLAAISGCSQDGSGESGRPVGSAGDPGAAFRDVAEEVGLRAFHFSGATGQYFFPEIASGGVAVIDYDGDGDLDVVVVTGGLVSPAEQMGRAIVRPPEGWRPGIRLFRNELNPSGKLQFTDVTEQARLRFDGYPMGIAVGDYNNDGHPDLFVTGFGRTALFRNNGDGTFTDVTKEAGVEDSTWTSSAAFVDFDHDGWLDLIVVRYVDFSIKRNTPCTGTGGDRDYCGPQVFRPLHARLFRNTGKGTFVDVTRQAGLLKAFGAGLGVAAADLNGDGLIDLYVANDGHANQLWINRGDGTFEETAVVAGAALSGDGKAQAGMGVAIGDLDNTGHEHIFVTNMTGEGNVFYRNNGKGVFSDATMVLGLLAPSLAYTGWGTQFFDFDNDGFLDLFVANGAVKIVDSLRGRPYPYQQRNLLFRNQAGKRFVNVTEAARAGLALVENSRGAAFGDLNNDGRVDIVVANNNGPLRLLLNEAATKNHWLMVQLEGVQSNRMGLGSRVGVLRDGHPTLWRRAHTDGSYLSASDHRVHFGLGPRAAIRGVVVRWPTGNAEVWESIPVDRIVTLREGTGRRWQER